MATNRIPMRRMTLKPNHKPKGNVHHFMEGRQMPRPTSMEIQRLVEGDACYIVYLDSREMVLSESWHPSLDAALYHGKWEWGIEPAEWETVGT